MKDNANLQTVFYNSESGSKIHKCIQCGTCSASCPMADAMDSGPRSLFALIRDGKMDDVINSSSPWMCTSCYNCTNRCPQQIPVTELMYGLKRLITASGEKTRSNRARDLHRSFSSSISLFGRVTESVVMAQYSIRHPLAGISSLPLAAQLRKRNRVELNIQRLKHPLKFRRSLKNLRK